MKRLATLAFCAILAACSLRQGALLPSNDAGTAAIPAALATHAIIGFSVDTPARAQKAASQGVNTTILYGGSPAPDSALAKALSKNGISVVDAGVSDILFYWECHRTHTVKPPPKSYSNYYCRTDEDPRVKSDAIVLQDVGKLLEKDAARPYVVGYWVLDDWPGWDPGSARELLAKIHALIVAKSPKHPAICGFAGGITKPGNVGWDPGTAANYSNDGCDVVGWYDYSPFGRLRPSFGKSLDWSMTRLLPAQAKSLKAKGWDIARTPLYGIGQAWAGSYNGKHFQPGLTVDEMRDQASAFCKFGANYVGWYAWDDSADNSKTQTPNNSKTISAGIAAAITACHTIWH